MNINLLVTGVTTWRCFDSIFFVVCVFVCVDDCVRVCANCVCVCVCVCKLCVCVCAWACVLCVCVVCSLRMCMCVTVRLKGKLFTVLSQLSIWHFKSIFPRLYSAVHALPQQLLSSTSRNRKTGSHYNPQDFLRGTNKTLTFISWLYFLYLHTVAK